MKEMCDKYKFAAGAGGRVCCRLSPRTLFKRDVVNNLYVQARGGRYRLLNA
jgi:hypothetical protein